MNLEDVLNEAIAKLPDMLKHDVEFKNVVTILRDLISEVSEEDCYMTLDKNRYNSSLFLESGCVNQFLDGDIIISLSYEQGKEFFYFAIYDLKEFGFGVDLNQTHYGTVNKKASVSLTKSKNKSVIKLESASYDDKMYYDYNVDIRYFDQNHNVIVKDLEALKDEIFSNKFFVPKEFARLMRLNFKRFYKQINIYWLNGAEKTNNEVEQQLGDLFCSPFRLGDLEDYIQNDFFDSFDTDKEVLYEVDSSKEDELDDFQDIDIDTDRVNMILNILAQHIDIDSMVIFSDSIINDLINYFSNDLLSLNTKGVVIERKMGIYMVYNIRIINNEFIVIPREVSVEELKNTYLKNPLNEDIKGLSEFIGDVPGR